MPQPPVGTDCNSSTTENFFILPPPYKKAPSVIHLPMLAKALKGEQVRRFREREIFPQVFFVDVADNALHDLFQIFVNPPEVFREVNAMATLAAITTPLEIGNRHAAGIGGNSWNKRNSYCFQNPLRLGSHGVIATLYDHFGLDHMHVLRGDLIFHRGRNQKVYRQMEKRVRV